MKLPIVLYTALLLTAASCRTARKVPATAPSTPVPAYSLNGNWRLQTSTDNKALEGTVVTVMPGESEALVRAVGNNSYCIREKEPLWRNLKNGPGGTFTLESLVNGCTDSRIYSPATLRFSGSEELYITARSSAGPEFVQTWKRVP
ncbi:MAG TPA: hypothetical protein VHK69_16450 [Chitinophagaceae bacterium]|jgi:hypothetical protein|nr:hypothetical protein [Chitinophagaceae bacterium]